ncbi:2,4-dichlorophenol 6-monooxygenase [Chryseotalea sanaruensis]|uniref:2,4-dichlorophenol 6-monooxygenase n=1 Tax=Chryseotalea sanaruensis TaxID=2482724 RepID=A0A401U6D6_9BACT|nr:FAD-dependent monooxygenase [Chryseotalea sanaruensis]GCC50498.1 2,4-dichlorophenol 6-monooxygenase [Chryseotalea sanaruensis]
MHKFETDVLIVGSGPAGSAAAALLSAYGVRNVVVTKYNWMANTPRAHITNQRAMEVFRDLGIEEEVNQKAVAQEFMGNNVFCTSLASEELGRLYSWGTHPNRLADYTLSSPTKICDIPQNLLEPILAHAGASKGSHYRFDTEYLGLEQDNEGVTATVRDRLSEEVYTIRAKYLLGADGGNSQVAKDINLPFEGQMGVGGSMNIVCEMDLTKYVAHRPSVLYWVLQPGSNVGGIGMGLVRMVRPWNEWLIVWGYDINDGPPKVTDELAKEIVLKLVGDPNIPIKIKSTSTWTVNHCYATQVSNGRVFCMGDAIHRHPPSNGLGSNTSIQDAFNIAWKVAMVVKGQAGEELLNSYNTERAPIAKQIVERANKSITEFGTIFQSLGLTDTTDPSVMRANMEKMKDHNDAAEMQREQLRQAILFKSYEFNCHGVEMNQRYTSNAVKSDGTIEPAYKRDKELYYEATTWPGARLPHVWIGNDNGHRISTLDLAGKGEFTLLTGIGGELWMNAAQALSTQLNIPIRLIQIGPGKKYTDLYGEWAAIREIKDAGCLLIRPDFHVAFRAKDIVSDAKEKLAEALTDILALNSKKLSEEKLHLSKSI